MAAERTLSLQDTFLNHLRENKVPVTTFLVNGVRLQGYVTRFDTFTVQLTRGESSQIVYKRAISAISPEGSIQLFTEVDDAKDASRV